MLLRSQENSFLRSSQGTRIIWTSGFFHIKRIWSQRENSNYRFLKDSFILSKFLPNSRAGVAEWLTARCLLCAVWTVWVQALSLHQCWWTHPQVCGLKRLSCHTDLYTVSMYHHTRGESEDHTSEKACKGSTLASKSMTDVTKSPKQGSQWPHEMDLFPQKCFLKNLLPKAQVKHSNFLNNKTGYLFSSTICWWYLWPVKMSLQDPVILFTRHSFISRVRWIWWKFRLLITFCGVNGNLWYFSSVFFKPTCRYNYAW